MKLDTVTTTNEMTDMLDSPVARTCGALAIFPEGSNVFLLRDVNQNTAEMSNELSERFGRFLHLSGRNKTN